MTPQQQALGIIRAEHRTLTAVIDAFEHVTREMAEGKLSPDFKLLWSIIYYIEEFPERLHHPKEDSALFPKVRARSHDIDDTLDELQRQHVNSKPHLETLKSLLGRMEADIPGSLPLLADKVKTYAAFHWKHMSLEETVVLPKAAEVLNEQDWADIAASFAENKDPLMAGGPPQDEWFRQFYRRLVTLVPEPWGVGTRH